MAATATAPAPPAPSSAPTSAPTQAPTSAPNSAASTGMTGLSAAQPVAADSAPQSNTTAGSYSSSPRQFPSDITDPILEEGGESGSESALEPVTPVSGRQSQDFSLHQDHQSLQSDHTTNNQPPTTPSKAALFSSQAPAPAVAAATPRPTAPTVPKDDNAASTPKAADPDPPPPALTRRSTRGSTAGTFKRTMSSLFRRSSSQIDKDSAIVDGPAASEAQSSRAGPAPTGTQRPSANKSSTTTRSSSPPSPGSPLEMARSAVTNGTLPAPDDFKKKNRASTGLTLRGRAVNFVGANLGRGGRPRQARRANSFDAGPQEQPTNADATFPPERLPWAMPPDSGTGVKARRMSLSLPDDFTVDVAELQAEFEYQHKLLGRHGKHLGKGAASKVTLMARKGSPTELYAVKEFRGKSGRESQGEYEKKIKSEFSIGKSLHHPNIVETVRLCTDHARWNHVMEYCSEGDLFGLVQKGFFKAEDKKKDRLCLFKQLIQGVHYLHDNGIAHRDIKLENLLITKDSKLKITDFGVSEVFCGTHPGLREAAGQCGQNMGEVRLCAPGICGSEPYIAPEVLQKKASYDPRALDVWSSAIVMIYLTFGGAIWSRAERGNVHYDKLVQGWEKWNKKHEATDSTLTDSDYPYCLALDVGVNPPALRRLLLQMLNPEPYKRIGIEEVVNNRWFKNIECCQLESYDDPSQSIDATKKDCCSKGGSRKIFCHSHLPPKSSGSHSLGKMPGTPGY